MSKTFQYTYYNRNLGKKVQLPPRINNISPSQQINQTIQSLKQQLQQKQTLLAELSARLQEQEHLLEEKQFIIKQKQIQLEYIHKENQQLHEKIFELNQKLNNQRADIKQTIKNEVGLLREEFNFMIKENEIKSNIILEQKEKEFIRKQEDLKSVIRDLSEKASSVNGSFYYQESHSNIIKSRNLPSQYILNRDQDVFQNSTEKHSSSNSNLRKSRESYRSTNLQNKYFSSLRESQAEQRVDRSTLLKEKVQSSLSNLHMMDKNNLHMIDQRRPQNTFYNTQTSPIRVPTGKPPLMSKQGVRRVAQTRQEMTRVPSKPSIEQIINRSRRQFDERNKKPSLTDLNKVHGRIVPSNYSTLYRKNEILDQSREQSRYVTDHSNEKSKNQKLKEISSLKMKVNMLKSELQEEISFCQHNQ